MAITFDSINGGALAEEFKLALAKVGLDFMDPNTDPKASREINIKIKFIPSGSGALRTTYEVKPKLAGFAKQETMIMVGQDMHTGRIEMSEYNNNRAQVAIYNSIPAEEKAFDPDTGEIYEGQSRGPRDLRAGR